MSEVTVIPVRSWSERRQFVRLPWELYQHDANWVPPLVRNQQQLLGYRSHPFHQIAEVQTYLARRGGRVVGRVAVLVNHRHNERYEELRGFFGFFECVEDARVAAALFDACRAWLNERGISRLRGPTNPSMNYECGLLIEGFDSPPVFMMTYNPPYYARLLENYGFQKAHDLLAYIGHRSQLPQVVEQLGGLADQAQERCNAIIRPLNTSAFLDDVRLFLDLYNRSLLATWGFVPLTEAELRALAASLRHLLVPELSLFAEVDGRPVGAILGLPDYNPVIKRIDGRLFPFGFWHLLRSKREVRRVRVLSINVVPEYQRWGLGLVLMKALVPKALELGVEEAEFSWVSEANDLARLGLEKGGARLYKRYRLYDLDWSPG